MPDTEAQKVKKILETKPQLTSSVVSRACKPETFFDETPLTENLYVPVLNKWIREIKRQLIPVVVQGDLADRLKEAHEELVDVETKLRAETSDLMIGVLKDEADMVREDIMLLEREWNQSVVAQQWLDTPQGAAWFKAVVDLGNGDYINRKVLPVLPQLYSARLANLGLEEYNKVIRAEKKQANEMAIMTMGVGLATGEPGSGKTVFIVVWNFMMKYLFGTKSILDFPPRSPFGDWYLFDADKLKIEAEKQELIQSGKLKESGIEELKDDDGNVLPQEAQWAAAYYNLLFRDAVFSADEYSDYYPRLGQGRTRMGAAIFNFHRKWRHNNLLILGATPRIEEVDINMCQRYITHFVTVQPHPEARDECTQAIIYPRRCVQGQYIADVKTQPFEFNIWGLESKDFLGGECFYHTFNTKNAQRLKLSKKLD